MKPVFMKCRMWRDGDGNARCGEEGGKAKEKTKLSSTEKNAALCKDYYKVLEAKGGDNMTF